MRRDEIRNHKIQKYVADALDHCDSIEEFAKYTREMVFLLPEYGEELLGEFHNYEDLFLRKLKKHYFVVKPETAHITLFVPNMYLKSLETNYIKTIKQEYSIFYKVNEYDVGKYIVKNDNLVNQYIAILKENGFDLSNVKGYYPKFMYVPCYCASFYSKGKSVTTMASGETYYKKMSKEEQKYLYDKCFKGRKEEMLPQYIIESDYFLDDKFARMPKFSALLKDILRGNTYNEEQEKELLKILDFKHDNIEAWFDEYYSNHKDFIVNNSKFGVKVLLTLYIKRVAYNMGIEKCKVNLFDYNLEYVGYANKHDNTVSITFKNGFLKGKNLLEIIYHELTHLKQYQNIKEMAFEKDPDIDIYCKDEIIQRVYGREYYKINYLNIASEMTAVYNAGVLSAKYNRSKEELFEYYKALGQKEIEANFDNIVDQEVCVEHVNRRYIKLEVNGRKQKVSRDLNELFVMALNKLNDSFMSTDKKLLNEILDEYPLIKYDYNLEKPIVRKSVDEIVELMHNSLGREKEIYKYLLLQRLKKDKNTKIEIKETCEKIRDLRETIEDEEFKREIGKILAKDMKIRMKKVDKHV